MVDGTLSSSDPASVSRAIAFSGSGDVVRGFHREPNACWRDGYAPGRRSARAIAFGPDGGIETRTKLNRQLNTSRKVAACSSKRDSPDNELTWMSEQFDVAQAKFGKYLNVA